MKKTKKVVLVALSYVLVIGLAIGGTIAWLTSTDEDVNVLTMGSVKIEQLEYERVVDENGKWVSTGTTDKYGYTPDAVQEFTQAKPLMPAVFKDGCIKWDDRNGSEDASGATSHQQSWAEIGAPGSNQLFDDSVKNAQDKFVFVKNTGKSDAYVRTWVALEQGSVAADDFMNVVMTSTNSNHWSWKAVATDVAIGDSTYYVICATYLGPKSNPTGILAPDAVSYASLLQVYMSPKATNEDVEAIDGNGNGTYDILVFSQATQTDGFDNADDALTTAFGTAHPWGDDVELPVVVSTAAELQAALDGASGETTIVLNDDITGDVTATQKANVKVTIEGNGNTFDGVILVDGKSATYTSAGLTIKNVNFKADSISADACIRLGDGTNATRYTCNVTVANCTFDVPGAVGVKSYTGGDKNLTITGCTATANAHSLVQAKGIDGILVENCDVYSKNGMNFNNSDNVTIVGCTADVLGYAVRFGESKGGVGAAETYLIEDCTLKSACDEGDAVIILRGTADYATLTIKNTTIDGAIEITNTATGATVVK